jgi:hypothetical protein
VLKADLSHETLAITNGVAGQVPPGKTWCMKGAACDTAEQRWWMC